MASQDGVGEDTSDIFVWKKVEWQKKAVEHANKYTNPGFVPPGPVIFFAEMFIEQLQSTHFAYRLESNTLKRFKKGLRRNNEKLISTGIFKEWHTHEQYGGIIEYCEWLLPGEKSIDPMPPIDQYNQKNLYYKRPVGTDIPLRTSKRPLNLMALTFSCTLLDYPRIVVILYKRETTRAREWQRLNQQVLDTVHKFNLAQIAGPQRVHKEVQKALKAQGLSTHTPHTTKESCYFQNDHRGYMVVKATVHYLQCANCKINQTPGHKFYRCPCGVTYCSRICQANHWRTHKVTNFHNTQESS